MFGASTSRSQVYGKSGPDTRTAVPHAVQQTLTCRKDALLRATPGPTFKARLLRNKESVGAMKERASLETSRRQVSEYVFLVLDTCLERSNRAAKNRSRVCVFLCHPRHTLLVLRIPTLFPNAVRKHRGALVQRLLGSTLWANRVLRISSRFSCWVSSLKPAVRA